MVQQQSLHIPDPSSNITMSEVISQKVAENATTTSHNTTPPLDDAITTPDAEFDYVDGCKLSIAKKGRNLFETNIDTANANDLVAVVDKQAKEERYLAF